MLPRFKALLAASKRTASSCRSLKPILPDSFGSRVFNRTVMQRMLPKEVCKNLLNAMDGHEKLRPEYADTIAIAMKEWAVSQGATHYSHWFQPLTGTSAEKHDAFIEYNSPDKIIECFTGKQLIQGEPDASSFPSGGLRSTYEARGYTGWDPSSPAFIWKAGDGNTLCIPTIFFSWTGDVLDSKIPVLRSDKKLNDAVLRLLKLTGIDARYVNSTLGCEQEYFVVDRALRNLRPDLLLMGRTVFGAPSPKGQELQDHYFGAVKDRILSFMHDFESAALQLGIPVKTRHNEVAPAQHEVAPVYEKASTAIDHNLLLMELMRQTAAHHELSCLLHEKPFHGLNGSGKHCNWSLATDTGINLLDPTDTPEESVHFLILLAAILSAIHRHSALLRGSVSYAANDFRLGGHEAPPAIMSVYLGKELEHVLDNIEKFGSHTRPDVKNTFDLGLLVLPDLMKDNTDRNRTSPFAFTGNKFEFRAVGSSANPALPISVLNAIVTESLNEMMDEIDKKLGHPIPRSKEELLSAVMPVIQQRIRSSKNIRFDGDNYTEEWAHEAARRDLPILKKSVSAFESFVSPTTIQAFEGILTETELRSRYEILHETYGHTVQIEAQLMLEIFRTQLLPAAVKQQQLWADSLHAVRELSVKISIENQLESLQILIGYIEEAIQKAEDLEKELKATSGIKDLRTKSLAYCEKVLPEAEKLRKVVDALELVIDDSLWPLPKYRELLFMV